MSVPSLEAWIPLEPFDPLFDLEPELPRRGRKPGRGGPQGAPALASAPCAQAFPSKPPPRPPRPPPAEPGLGEPPRITPVRRARRRGEARLSLGAPLLVVLAALSLSACGGAEVPGLRATDSVLVQLAEASALPAHAQADRGSGPPIVALGSVGAEGEPPLLRVPVPEGEDAAELARTLARDEAVAFAEPVYLYQPSRAPNDPRLKDLWGLAKIDAPGAWAQVTGDRSVTVAIVDDGLALDHPDLKPNLWVNPEEIAGNGKDDDGDGIVDDVHGANFVDGAQDGDPSPASSGTERWHGSHVSGTIGAAGDNKTGVVGVNWRVSLMGVRAMGPQGGRSDDLARAIDYAVDHGARVINASWGGGGQSQVITKAITRAQKRGVLFVVAAGNDAAKSPGYPANLALDNLISVGASGPDDLLASFSDRGALVAAPGVGILSTTAPGQYERYDGTSMAAPHVTGLAALLFAAKPHATLREVRDAILSSAVPMTGTKHGRIDAKAALLALGNGGAGQDGALELSRTALSFAAATGKVPRAQTVTLRSSSGDPVDWKASADAAWVQLPRLEGTTPSRLTVRVDPAKLAAGDHQALVKIAPKTGQAKPLEIAVSLRVGRGWDLAAAGPACALRDGALHVRAGTICALAAPGVTADAMAPAIEWRLPGGALERGARLVARFVRPGHFQLQVSAAEGEPEQVAIVIE